MKKRKNENDENEEHHHQQKDSKSLKKEEWIDSQKMEKKEKEKRMKDLPKVLILFLSSFFDLDTLLNFSSTNKKYRSYFFEFRKIFSFLNQMRFFEHFGKEKNTLSKRKEIIKNRLIERNFKDLTCRYGMTPLHYACRK